jgi:2,4-didehydro-3-deoxy-L-rhamnonate hydrolase
VTFRLANIAGRAALVEQDHYFDLERISAGQFDANPMNAIARADELHSIDLRGATPDGPIAGADLRAPVPSPRNCFAIGLNYRKHAAEAGMELPPAPLVFTKFPSCLVGPHHTITVVGEHIDYEAELVVVIGKGGRNIAAADAWNHIAGLTAGQDVSDRQLQFAAKPPHFDLGKSRDTFGPIGPMVVSTDSVANPDDVTITCTVNGERRQHDSSKNMIFDVPYLIEYLSSILTLSPGDLIFTGTPEGVGATTSRFLAPGDVVETQIEGIGSLRNVCV